MAMYTQQIIDHVHLRVSSLPRSRRFYSATLGTLGLEIEGDEEHFTCGELFVDLANGHVSRVHLAFRAKNRDQVAQFHAAGISSGGVDNGGPGLRPEYHHAYYGAFVLDPDGNNIEAVWHGPAT